MLDVQRAAQVLSDMLRLIETATTEERCGLIQQVIRQIWLTDEGIAGWEPAPNYVLLVEAVVGAVDMVTSTGIEAAPRRSALWRAFAVPA